MEKRLGPNVLLIFTMCYTCRAQGAPQLVSSGHSMTHKKPVAVLRESSELTTDAIVAAGETNPEVVAIYDGARKTIWGGVRPDYLVESGKQMLGVSIRGNHLAITSGLSTYTGTSKAAPEQIVAVVGELEKQYHSVARSGSDSVEAFDLSSLLFDSASKPDSELFSARIKPGYVITSLKRKGDNLTIGLETHDHNSKATLTLDSKFLVNAASVNGRPIPLVFQHGRLASGIGTFFKSWSPTMLHRIPSKNGELALLLQQGDLLNPRGPYAALTRLCDEQRSLAWMGPVPQRMESSGKGILLTGVRTDGKIWISQAFPKHASQLQAEFNRDGLAAIVDRLEANRWSHVEINLSQWLGGKVIYTDRLSHKDNEIHVQVKNDIEQEVDVVCDLNNGSWKVTNSSGRVFQLGNEIQVFGDGLLKVSP